jgi:hypothetical protein
MKVIVVGDPHRCGTCDQYRADDRALVAKTLIQPDRIVKVWQCRHPCAYLRRLREKKIPIVETPRE